MNEHEAKKEIAQAEEELLEAKNWKNYTKLQSKDIEYPCHSELNAASLRISAA